VVIFVPGTILTVFERSTDLFVLGSEKSAMTQKKKCNDSVETKMAMRLHPTTLS